MALCTDKLNAAGSSRGNRPLQKIMDLTIRPSLDLGVMAARLVAGEEGSLELSSFLRLFMKAFSSGAQPQEADLLSYLLFDKNFTQALAALGHADAKAREKELIAFFSDDPID